MHMLKSLKVDYILTEHPPSGSCRSPIPPSIEEESIADALHRLTMRQLTRQRKHSSVGRSTNPRHSRLAWTTVGGGAHGGNGDSTTLNTHLD